MSNRNDLQSELTSDRDARLLDAVRRELDRSVAALDGQTLSRLHTIRSQTLEAKRRSALARLWLPVSGLATTCALVLALGLYWHGNHGTVSGNNADAMEDMDILASNEGPDFYANYEFYQWLTQD
ncbi:MAG TPA: hypothetical protein VMH83_04185 [Candidatus Acidoferrum sp.]|nr:hypothetical protein [Candidatus Acidoferrum sp.]